MKLLIALWYDAGRPETAGNGISDTSSDDNFDDDSTEVGN